jgi:beta-galactosidase
LECWITISLQLEEATAWAESGHEVAWTQHLLYQREWPGSPTTPTHGLQLQASKGLYQISGSNFSFRFDRILGRMDDWQWHNQPLFTSFPTLGVWRPPTENDIKYDAAMWDNYSLNNLQTRVSSVSMSRSSGGSLQITAEVYIGAVIRDWGFLTTVTHTFYDNGTFVLSFHLRPRGFKPPILPRIGLDITLPKRLSAVDWFGCGPEESYSDKSGSQKVGLHSRTADTLHTSYEFPQENGNRSGTRWLRLRDSLGRGFQVTRMDETGTTGSSFDFTAQHYTAKDLADARHPTDLAKRDEVFLRLDAAHAGLGTARCGPGTLEKYQVPCEETSFAFVFKPL